MTRHSITFTVPTTATQVGLLFQMTPTGTAGADDSVAITGVQLEIAGTASPFEFRTAADELAICERYYEKGANLGVVPGVSGLGNVRVLIAATTSFLQGFSFRVRKRADPTLTIWSRNNTNAKVSAVTTGADVGTSVTGFTVNQGGLSLLQDSGGGFTAGAAYECSYAAAAEL